jgi:hypothetical protein
VRGPPEEADAGGRGGGEGDEADDPHLASPGGGQKREQLVDASEELGPEYATRSRSYGVQVLFQRCQWHKREIEGTPVGLPYNALEPKDRAPSRGPRVKNADRRRYLTLYLATPFIIRALTEASDSDLGS